MCQNETSNANLLCIVPSAWLKKKSGIFSHSPHLPRGCLNLSQKKGMSAQHLPNGVPKIRVRLSQKYGSGCPKSMGQVVLNDGLVSTVKKDTITAENQPM